MGFNSGFKGLNSYISTVTKLVVSVKLVTCTREVLGLNLGCSVLFKAFRAFFSVCLGKGQCYALNKAVPVSFHRLQSSVGCYSSIRLYVVVIY